jgi:DNA-binding transcriptional LysR family regulator
MYRGAVHRLPSQGRFSGGCLSGAVIRYFNTSCLLAESGVGVAIVDPLLSGRFNLAIRPFDPATQISASVVRSRKRQLSRAAEAFLRKVRVVAGEISENLVSRSLRRSSRASGVFAGEIAGRDKA